LFFKTTETNNQHHNFTLLDSFISIRKVKEEMNRFFGTEANQSLKNSLKKFLNTSSN